MKNRDCTPGKVLEHPVLATFYQNIIYFLSFPTLKNINGN